MLAGVISESQYPGEILGFITGRRDSCLASSRREQKMKLGSVGGLAFSPAAGFAVLALSGNAWATSSFVLQSDVQVSPVIHPASPSPELRFPSPHRSVCWDSVSWH
jgi:hypothetical protein